ncbi:MAG TPA: GMC family oxidoreductase [Candidatus Binatia bacterium]|jgi:choline dehydrogenase-like flavoprotein|nr:GMC family oxidoreductase [Candidatus Binatia bacterium]
MRKRAVPAVLGNTTLATFDVCIIGSGAGGGTAAHVLTQAGKNVLVIEAGPNPFPGLDDPDVVPMPLHSNDELKYSVRGYIDQIGALEPRTWRQRATDAAQVRASVNTLPKTVGGAFTHADCKTPRFNAVDFRLKSAVEELIAATPGLAVPGFGGDAGSANFADWPFSYDDLEPFYVEAERLYGVQGTDDNPFASPRSAPYPMPPGVAMYLGVVLTRGALATSFLGSPLHPHTYPAAIASRPTDDGRPACVDCGLCSGFGCPSNAKGSPAVTSLRRALLSGRCQLRHDAQVVRLVHTGSHVGAVEYIDADGALQTATADAFMLAASPIESARLCLLSEGLGNGSGQVGRNLMFHLQSNVNGFLPERVHGQRGRAVTHGITDFRGVEPGGDALRVVPMPDGPRVYLGGICEFSSSQGLPITEDGGVYAVDLPGPFGRRRGIGLKNALRDGALGQHLIGLIMQAEDAPQLGNMMDLDPTVRDVFDRPVPRVTYASHAFERASRVFYVPFMRDVVTNAGASQAFVNPTDGALGDPPSSSHVLGTLRMGTDPATSVVDAGGRFHDVDNLWACDGSVFPTSSGYNPTLTIIAVALRIAHGIAGTAPIL